MDLSDLAVPDWVKGKRAFHLLSSFALRQWVQEAAVTLQLDPNDPGLLPKFDACLVSESKIIRTAAYKIAEDYGRSLAYLLLTLKRGDAINQQARPVWEPIHWAFWAQIETVWLGGGLLSGNLGKTAVPLARQLIHPNGFPGFRLELSPYGRHLPLLGLACTAPPDTQAMLVFDFGQTAVKQGLAHYKGGSLVEIELLPPSSANCDDVLRPSQDKSEIIQFADDLLDLLATTWRETAVSYPSLSPTVAISLACYLLDGQPSPEDVGCYGRMQHITSNLQQFLTDGLRQRLGHAAYVNLWHDGAAAGLSQAGTRQTPALSRAKVAVLTFGTAIGVGFPPEQGQFVPVASAFCFVLPATHN